MRTPANDTEAFTFTLYQYGRYRRCEHCGAIGRVIHSYRSGVTPLNPSGQQQWKERADQWNQRADETRTGSEAQS